MTCLQRNEAQNKDLENPADAYYVYHVQVWQQLSKFFFFVCTTVGWVCNKNPFMCFSGWELSRALWKSQ